MAAIEAVDEFARIEHPVFLHAVQFVGGELLLGVALDRGGRQDFADPRGRKRRVALGKARDLRVREENEIGHERVPRTEADGDAAPVKCAELFFLDVAAEQVAEHIMEVGVIETRRVVRMDEPADQIRKDAGFEPVEKFL